MTIETKFEKRYRLIPLASIISLTPDVVGRNSPKYRQILASIRCVGIVEPPVVFPLHDTDTFAVLDGRARIQAIRELKQTEVACLIATEDDSYTYNRQISRLSPVQDQRMIAAAIKQGVPLDRLAAALDISPSVLTRRRTLIDGVCAEVQTLLADKLIPRQIFEILKRMKPLRQIEACELMEGQANWSAPFARAILAGTPDEQMAHARKKQANTGSIEQMARLEKELATLQETVRSVEASYGPDVLRFTVIKTYVAEVLSKPAFVAIMRSRYPDLLKQFEKIADISSLPDTAPLVLPRADSYAHALPS